jgi:predicted RNase H-like HicB family nuclease
METLVKSLKVRVFQEKDRSWAAACSVLGVYATGRTLAELKKNFAEALDLHLNVVRQKAVAAISSTA